MELKILLIINFIFIYMFYFFSTFFRVIRIFFLNQGCLVLDFILPRRSVLGLDISFRFLFDWTSRLFFSCVSLISGSVFLYSYYYMGYINFFNNDVNRFFFVLFFFVLRMFFLVFSFSWFVVILGWDGLGVVSFLLVIYYNNPSRVDSGLVTFFINRLGDCFFILTFMFIFYRGLFSFDYLIINLRTLFVCFLILGMITKRAQVPFSSWLPLAMAAPTPVSSLVHSSTLVTAGVYLIVRFNYLLQEVRFYVIILGLLTIFLGGFCSLVEKDFKKVVAMSTLSQLGFIVFTLSQGFWILCYLHILFHAFFKRLLFLSTGGLINNLFGIQDSRYFGRFFSPFGMVFFNLSVIRLIGFPFFLGFFSKDRILGGLFALGDPISVIFLICCCLTVAYSLRLLFIGYFIFPAFFRFITTKDDLVFFFSVFVIYVFCWFVGNFVFYNFFVFNEVFFFFWLFCWGGSCFFRGSSFFCF